MSQMELKIDLSWLHDSPRKASFSAPVWWKLGDCEYPEANWTDFPLVLVQWWTAKAIELLNGENYIQLQFMDGNFAINLTKKQTTLVVTCLENDCILETNLNSFIEEMCKANRYLIEELAHIDVLRAEVDKLKRGLILLNFRE